MICNFRHKCNRKTRGRKATKWKKALQYEIKLKQQKNKNKRQRSHNRQHDTDDGGQAMDEEMRHVQMSRWSKGERSKQQYRLWGKEQRILTQHFITKTYKSWRNRNLPTDHSGMSFMDEFFLTRCMVSPNEVEEKGVDRLQQY